MKKTRSKKAKQQLIDTLVQANSPDNTAVCHCEWCWACG